MTCDQCEYIGGACIHCGQKQPVFNGKKEAVLSSINFGSKIAPTTLVLKSHLPPKFQRKNALQVKHNTKLTG